MAEQQAALEHLVERLNILIERLMPPAPNACPDFARYSAFRWTGPGADGHLSAVEYPQMYDIGQLVGLDGIRDAVIRNTAQFVAGHPANNVLLWGERGNGKSSLVKGVLPLFAHQGLRMVELKRWDLLVMPDIIRLLRHQPYFFILFCDDLSFDEGESDFRTLKTLLDGDIEEKPANILVYATSNRRHLVPERMELNAGQGEIHPDEAVGERLALSDRFGISLGFYSLDQDEYLAIVRHYAADRKLAVNDDRLCDLALQWHRSTGRRSGRSARQFIDDLQGRLCMSEDDGFFRSTERMISGV